MKFTTVYKIVWLGVMIVALFYVLRSTLPEPIEPNWIEEPSDELMDFKSYARTYKSAIQCSNQCESI